MCLGRGPHRGTAYRLQEHRILQGPLDDLGGRGLTGFSSYQIYSKRRDTIDYEAFGKTFKIVEK